MEPDCRHRCREFFLSLKLLSSPLSCAEQPGPKRTHAVVACWSTIRGKFTSQISISLVGDSRETVPSATVSQGTRGLRAPYAAEREIFLPSALCRGCEMVVCHLYSRSPLVPANQNHSACTKQSH